MLSTTTIVALAASFATVGSALTIGSPASLIECEPVSLAWSGSTSQPFYLSVIPGGDASAPALETLPSVTASPATWTVDIASGTNVTIKIVDSTGVIAYSSAVVIQPGSSTTCLNSGSSANGASSTPASTSGASGAADAAVVASSSTSSTSAVGSASASKSSSSTSTAPAAASPSSGAAHPLARLSAGAMAIGFFAAAFGVVA